MNDDLATMLGGNTSDISAKLSYDTTTGNMYYINNNGPFTTNLPYNSITASPNTTATWSSWINPDVYEPKKWLGFTEVYKVISKTKVFAGIPKWKYVVQFEELPNDGIYLNEGWPWMVEGCNDWIFINSAINDNLSFVEFEVPLHVKISEKDRIAPLNQFKDKFENADIMDLVNRKK